MVDDIDVMIGEVGLGRVTSYNYLGFQLDENLNFSTHISQVISSCSQKLYWLSKIRKYISHHTAVQLYKSLIMSKLLYGCVFYYNAPLIARKQLQKIQNKALRICFLADRYTSNLTLHREAKVLPLVLRSKLEMYKLMYRESRRAWAEKENDNIAPMYTTRAQNAFPLIAETPRTNRFLTSISYQGPKTWLELTSDLKRCEYDKFCSRVRERIVAEFAEITSI